MIEPQRSNAQHPKAWETQELDSADLVEEEEVMVTADPTTTTTPTGTTDDRGDGCVSIATLHAAHNGLAVEDDAYFHPGGRVRLIADANATLDGWRPEPTIVIRRVRARTRRSWLVLGLVAIGAPALLLVAIMMAVGTSTLSSAGPSNSARHTADVTRSPLGSKEIRGRYSIPVRSVQSLRRAPSRR
jgi:hypothetical protein